MGGFGSGRPAWRTKAEDLLSLDVNRLRRAGYLSPGTWGRWSWSRGGEPAGNIHLGGTVGGLRLSYRVREWGEEWEGRDYTVPVTWADCTKGGKRPYFRCPGARPGGGPCARRVGKLYSRGGWFLCRHCHSLTYASRSEDRRDRLLRRANRLRQAMGGEPGMGELLPLRRKGQWRKTYEAKIERILELEGEADLEFVAWVGRRFPGLGERGLLG